MGIIRLGWRGGGRCGHAIRPGVVGVPLETQGQVRFEPDVLRVNFTTLLRSWLRGV